MHLQINGYSHHAYKTPKQNSSQRSRTTNAPLLAPALILEDARHNMIQRQAVNRKKTKSHTSQHLLAVLGKRSLQLPHQTLQPDAPLAVGL